MVSTVASRPTDVSASASASGPMPSASRASLRHSASEIDGHPFADLLEAGAQQGDLLAQGELVFRRVAEDGVGHVVVGADLLPGVGQLQQGLQLPGEALLPVGHQWSSLA